MKILKLKFNLIPIIVIILLLLLIFGCVRPYPTEPVEGEKLKDYSGNVYYVERGGFPFYYLYKIEKGRNNSIKLVPIDPKSIDSKVVVWDDKKFVVKVNYYLCYNVKLYYQDLLTD